MRDSNIIHEQQRMRHIVDNNTMALAQQFSALIARQAALEEVLFGGRFAAIRLAVALLFRGGNYIGQRVAFLQNKTLEDMRAYTDSIRKENQKKIQVVKQQAGGIIKP